MSRKIATLACFVLALCFLATTSAGATCTTTGGCPLTPGPTGGTCLQDEFFVETGSTHSLGCTANDVVIAKAQNPRGLDGTPITQCTQGSTFNMIADFQVVTNSNSSRSNIGLYMNTKDQVGGALAAGNTCVDNIISKVHAPGSNTADNCSNTVGQTPQCLGGTSYQELDPQTTPQGASVPDNCGDGSSGSSQLITVEVDGVKCEPAAGCTGNNCNVVLPNCTSWQIPGGTIQCETGPDNNALTGWLYSTAAIPGTTSKCSCNNTFTIPVLVINAALGVTKSANPTTIPAGTDGGTSTYTVTVKNNNNAGTDTVSQICDSQYGTIFQAAGFAGAACNPATPVDSLQVSNITCPATGSLTLNPGDSMTCTFVGTIPENDSVADTATVTAAVSNGTTVTQQSNQVTVTSGDASPSASVSKTLGASVTPTQGCAEVQYNVSVSNGSGTGTDEAETLSALMDNIYGDITTLHGDIHTNGSVTQTNCAVPQSLPVSGAGSTYSCSFTGVACGNLTTSATCPNGGLSVSDTITPTLAGDEAGEVVSVTGGSLTADVCFTASGVAQ